jgi:hypothetical protein
MAKFNKFLTFGRFKKNQLRTARRFMAAHFDQSEHVLVKFHAAFQVIQSVPRMQKFFGFHGEKHRRQKLGCQQSALKFSSDPSAIYQTRF